jgi:hypothetical protein
MATAFQIHPEPAPELSALVPPTHTFSTTVLRGKSEREYPVEAGYQIIAGKAVLTRWCILGDTYDLTASELERLDEEAQDDANEVLSEMAPYAERVGFGL